MAQNIDSDELMVIAVVGATGELGARVVRSLNERGTTVRALVRQASDNKKVAHLRSLDAVTIELDMENVPAITEALGRSAA
jgi:uncharacterized protein YbjT (DUF2867 family)